MKASEMGRCLFTVGDAVIFVEETTIGSLLEKELLTPPPLFNMQNGLLNYNTYDVARLTVGSQLTDKLLKNNIPTLESNTVRCACSLESIRHFLKRLRI